MAKLSLTSITPSTDGSGKVLLTIVPVDEANNPILGLPTTIVELAQADVATALSSGNTAQKAAAIKALILAANPELGKTECEAVIAANVAAAAQATALGALVPSLPYKFALS